MITFEGPDRGIPWAAARVPAPNNPAATAANPLNNDLRFICDPPS
jgi:hypothetical protein